MLPGVACMAVHTMQLRGNAASEVSNLQRGWQGPVCYWKVQCLTCFFKEQKYKNMKWKGGKKVSGWSKHFLLKEVSISVLILFFLKWHTYIRQKVRLNRLIKTFHFELCWFSIIQMLYIFFLILLVSFGLVGFFSLPPRFLQAKCHCNWTVFINALILVKVIFWI